MESFTHPTVRPRTFAASSSSNSASGGSSEAPTHSRRFRLLAATRPTPIQLVGRTMASAAHPSHCTSRCSSNMDGNPMPPSMCDGAEIQRRWYLRVMLEVYRMRSVTARTGKAQGHGVSERVQHGASHGEARIELRVDKDGEELVLSGSAHPGGKSTHTQ